MYLEFFELKEKPFSLTPDPRFLFLGESHRQALEHMLYGIREREGFILIVGDIGTGKTTICRELLESLDREVSSALVLNPLLSEQELLESILQDFGIPSGKESPAGQEGQGRGRDIFSRLDSETQTALELNPMMPGNKVLENILKHVDQPSPGLSKKELIDRLNQFLLDRARGGGNAVLIIDEAQNLSPSVLEQVRILSNLETTKQKLLQIVLVGQLELKHKLERPGLRQLNQRISVRYQLKPLTRHETKRYIDHRLFVAGSNSAVVFTEEACEEIFNYSLGVPRLINMLCERCMLGAYVDQVRRIDRDLVERCRASLESNLSEDSFLTSAPSADAATVQSGAGAVSDWAAQRKAGKKSGERRDAVPGEAVAQPWERWSGNRLTLWRKKASVRVAAALILVAALTAAGLLFWKAVQGPAEAGRKSGAAAQAVPQKMSAPAPPAEIPAVRLAYSIQLGAFRNFEDGMENIRLLTEQGLQGTVYLVPLHIVQLGGRWYRLFFGGYPSSEAARDDVNKLVDRGLIKAGSARILETPLAYRLGDYVGDRAVEEKSRTCLERWRIPTYALVMEQKEDHTVYRLYAGAFEKKDDAKFLGDRLEEAQLDHELVDRLGCWPPKN